MKQLFRTATLLILLITVIALDATAQVGIGASYERRSDAPTNGFGIQIEKNVLGFIPVVYLRTRLHASYFSEDASLNLGAIQVNSGKVEAYDFGGALLAGAGFGLFSPYAGVGVGFENWAFDGDTETNNTMFYYGIAGIAITPIPFIKPYLEYRLATYNDLSAARKEIGEGPGRLHIGVTIRF
jgi:opacity protein-like surface antigen